MCSSDLLVKDLEVFRGSFPQAAIQVQDGVGHGLGVPDVALVAVGPGGARELRSYDLDDRFDVPIGDIEPHFPLDLVHQGVEGNRHHVVGSDERLDGLMEFQTIGEREPVVALDHGRNPFWKGVQETLETTE